MASIKQDFTLARRAISAEAELLESASPRSRRSSISGVQSFLARSDGHPVLLPPLGLGLLFHTFLSHHQGTAGGACLLH